MESILKAEAEMSKNAVKKGTWIFMVLGLYDESTKSTNISLSDHLIV